MKVFPLACFTLAILSVPALASQPLQLSIPDNNLPPGNVEGGRVSIFYGTTDTVKGVDISVFGLSQSNNFTGFSWGFYGAHRVTNKFEGFSLSVGNWHDNSGRGAVLGLANFTKNNFTGLQLGAVNFAGTLNGVQIGFINATNRINKGVQIGFINYDKSGTFVSKDLPVFPIINGRF